MRRLLTFLSLFSFCSAFMLANTLFAQEEAVYVRAGRLLDVRSGDTLSNQAILIRGDRIERVGPWDEVAVPHGARVIDLGGATVLPGLIDLHVHLTSDHRYQGYRKLALSVSRRAIHGVVNARKTLDAGFTTVRNVGGPGYADVALRDAINDGEILGPRMSASGPALGITGGHCDSNLLPPEFAYTAEGVADGPWEVRAKVREVAKYGADVVKFCATGGVLSKGTAISARQYTLEEMEALVDEAHTLGRKVAAHAHSADGIKTAIRAGVDSVEHASLIDDEGIRLAKENGTVMVMDIYVDTFILERGAETGMLPESIRKEKEVGQAQRENFRRLHQAGVRIGFGTDAAVYPHGDNAKQFAYMVEYGMSPLEAIRAATIHAAELLGWTDDVGVIEPGRFADFIAVDGDPLSDVTLLERVDFVAKGGEVITDRLTAGVKERTRTRETAPR
jgi:imidazolonepropionase-like amidohydrolase